MRLVAKTCRLCNVPGTSPDPLNADFPGRRWGYKVRVIGQKNSGMCCWYCTKIYEARYKVQRKVSISDLPGWLGEDQERTNRLKHLLDKGIEHMKNGAIERQGSKEGQENLLGGALGPWRGPAWAEAKAP